MATIKDLSLGKILGQSYKNLNEHLTTPVGRALTTGPLNKLWVNAILRTRENSDKPKDFSREVNQAHLDYNKHIATPSSESQAQKNSEYNIKIKKPKESDRYQYENHTRAHSERQSALVSNKTPNQVIILNTIDSPASYVVLQNRPSVVNVDNQTSWTSIKSMGRNNHYQVYGGSEDTLSFEISWFCNDEERTSVISNCRLLEAWSKADGYTKAPPVLEILWGDSELFLDQQFILTNASYKLTQFQDHSRQPGTSSRVFDGKTDQLDGYPINLGLYPTVAVQTLVFKRVSYSNLTHDNVIFDSNQRNFKVQNGISL